MDPMNEPRPRHDDPFSVGDSAATWVETGPPLVGDTVKIELLARVVKTVGIEYVEVEVAEMGGQQLTYRADEVAVVARAESG